jgi:hypothetical protein
MSAEKIDFLRSARSHQKIEIFDLVKIPPIFKSLKLRYGTHAISLPRGKPDIRTYIQN